MSLSILRRCDLVQGKSTVEEIKVNGGFWQNLNLRFRRKMEFGSQHEAHAYNILRNMRKG